MPVSLDFAFLIDHIPDVSGSIWQQFNPSLLLFFLPEVLLMAALLLPRMNTLLDYLDNTVILKIRKKILVLGIGILAAYFLPNLNFMYTNYFPGGMHPFFKFMAIGPCPYYTGEALNFIKARLANTAIDKKQLAETLESVASNRIMMSDAAVPWLNKPDRPNIIFLQFESLKSEAMGLTFNNMPLLPNAETLARNGMYFQNFYAQGKTTADCDFIVLNSLLPLQSGLLVTKHDKQFVTLPKILQENGWTTIVLNGARKTFWNHARMYQAYGFDEFKALEDFPDEERIGLGLSDAAIFRQAEKLLKEAKKPCFLLFTTLTSHHPFSMPESKRSLHANTGEIQADDYFASINYADAELGKFIDSLNQNGLLDNTIIFMYGDHTIRMNYFFDKITAKYLAKARLAFPEVHFLDSKVPLVIYSPKHLKAEQISLVSGQIDLAPTVLNMLDLKPPQTFLGNSLFSPTHPNAVMNFAGIGRTSNTVVSNYLQKTRSFSTGFNIEDGHAVSAPDATNKLAYHLWLSQAILSFDPAEILSRKRNALD